MPKGSGKRIDPKTREKALADLRNGDFYKDVAARYGLNPGTVAGWKSRKAGVTVKESGGKVSVVDVQFNPDEFDQLEIDQIIKSLANSRMFVASRAIYAFRRLDQRANSFLEAANSIEGDKDEDKKKREYYLSQEAEARAQLIAAGVRLDPMLQSIGVKGVPEDAVTTEQLGIMYHIQALAQSLPPLIPGEKRETFWKQVN